MCATTGEAFPEAAPALTGYWTVPNLWKRSMIVLKNNRPKDLNDLQTASCLDICSDEMSWKDSAISTTIWGFTNFGSKPICQLCRKRCRSWKDALLFMIGCLTYLSTLNRLTAWSILFLWILAVYSTPSNPTWCWTNWWITDNHLRFNECARIKSKKLQQRLFCLRKFNHSRVGRSILHLFYKSVL